MVVHLLNGTNQQNGLSITMYTLTMFDGLFKSPGSMIFTNATSSQITFLKLLTTFFGLCLRLPRILVPIQHFIDSCSKFDEISVNTVNSLENDFVQVLKEKKYQMCLAVAETFFSFEGPHFKLLHRFLQSVWTISRSAQGHCFLNLRFCFKCFHEIANFKYVKQLQNSYVLAKCCTFGNSLFLRCTQC